MSSSNYYRFWIDRPHLDPNMRLLTEEYQRGITEFMGLVQRQPEAETGMLRCPCSNCKNRKIIKECDVWTHLYLNGFTRSYKIWYHHGETDYEYGSTSEPQPAVRLEEPIRMDVDYGVGTEQMVNDHFRGEDLPNAEAMRFYDMLDAGKQPLYEGCRDGHSALSSVTRLMGIKTDYNLAEDCVDAIADFVKGILPEDNVASGSYYEVQKLVAGFGLSYQVIDVCSDNCMIYWRADEHRVTYKFCGKARYKDTSGRVPVPFKRMWYLPLTKRLQRLYQSERTTQPMRWHAEHSTNGEIRHPSDAKAWKHFQSKYPDFAYERRNIYLGLCTDGFSPFGKSGRQYSLWPVILTPYNLPPNLCLRREFLFFSILVPGPEHPKRSLDVFLQPLIYELQQLWAEGAETYDVSCKENFQMRAVLMWTIRDFPAYDMLSGWTTHGRLSCPYCQDNTDAFQLKHGRKTCWFDCHRRFLPPDHPYRRSRNLFTKNKRVFDSPPPEICGADLSTQLRDFGAERMQDQGGHVHYPVDAVGKLHNWHKKSIFWDLPYWKDHLLRHNLDAIHIEKNFFDNPMNTILNVQGKTKDNLKSRLDLVDICARSELHVDDNGRAPFPIYRLDAEGKYAFFDWISNDVKFPDGYASNLRNCVDRKEGKFIVLKSHDCHDDATMAEPDDSSTKDKPGWINGEDADLKPADETEDELEPAEESMLELKPAELSELSDTSLELNELSDTEDGAGLVAGRNEHFSAQRKIHNKFNLGRFYTKFDQTFPQSISSPFSSRMPRGSQQGSLGLYLFVLCRTLLCFLVRLSPSKQPLIRWTCASYQATFRNPSFGGLVSHIKHQLKSGSIIGPSATHCVTVQSISSPFWRVHIPLVRSSDPSLFLGVSSGIRATQPNFERRLLSDHKI
ncbi:hypothetical protein YC2023_086712 [Brassica napus]